MTIEEEIARLNEEESNRYWLAISGVLAPDSLLDAVGRNDKVRVTQLNNQQRRVRRLLEIVSQQQEEIKRLQKELSESQEQEVINLNMANDILNGDDYRAVIEENKRLREWLEVIAWGCLSHLKGLDECVQYQRDMAKQALEEK